MVKRYRVIIMPRAERQAEVIDAWWREHRVEAADLFERELVAATLSLETLPHSVGSPYRTARRLLLRRTHHHVYYVVDEARATVEIRAVWHAARGGGPSLH